MDFDKIIDDFISICKIAGLKLSKKEIEKTEWHAGEGHKPEKLKKGYMAVYIFTNPLNTECYKVGKVFKNSNARFQTQHYSPSSSRSNLAKSLLDDYTVNGNFTQDNISEWIKQNTTRTNLLIDAKKAISTLNLLEAFLQVKLDPKYEGRKSLKKRRPNSG